MRAIRLIQRDATTPKIYYGIVRDEDNQSYTLICCDHRMNCIDSKKILRKDYDEIPFDITELKEMFTECLNILNKEEAYRFFDYEYAKKVYRDSINFYNTFEEEDICT